MFQTLISQKGVKLENVTIDYLLGSHILVVQYHFQQI